MSSSDEEELILFGVSAIDLSRTQPKREKSPVDPLILFARRVTGTEWKNEKPKKTDNKVTADRTLSDSSRQPSEVNRQQRPRRTAAKKSEPKKQKKKIPQPKTSVKETLKENQTPLKAKKPRGRPKKKPVGFKPVPTKKPVEEPVRIYKSRRLQEKEDLKKVINRSKRQAAAARVHYMLGTKTEPLFNPEEDMKDFDFRPCLGHLSDLGKSSKSGAAKFKQPKVPKVQAATARVAKPEFTIPSLDLKTEPVDDSATPSAANPWGSTVGMEIIKQTTDENEVIDLTEWEVEKILGHKVWRKKVSFKVRWQYWSSEYDSWEPKEHLTNCPEVIQAYVDTLSEKQRKRIL